MSKATMYALVAAVAGFLIAGSLAKRGKYPAMIQF